MPEPCPLYDVNPFPNLMSAVLGTRNMSAQAGEDQDEAHGETRFGMDLDGNLSI